MIPRLILLTDRSQLALGRGLVRTVAECVEAGLGAVVVREHDLPSAARSALVQQLAALDGLTVISSRLPHAAAVGLHVAAHQPAPTGWWGRSCHAAEEVPLAASQGASWATLSPYAESTSKPGHGPPVSPSDLAGHSIPVFALGGIHVGNAAEAVAHGAYGVAVMGAVMRAAQPAQVLADVLVEVTR